MNNVEIFFGVGMFIVIVLVLVFIIMFVKFKLVLSGDVIIIINGDLDKVIKIVSGGKFFGVLVDVGYFVLFVCGGGGLCGQCCVDVYLGGGEILFIEFDYIMKGEVCEGCCFLCQVVIK